MQARQVVHFVYVISSGGNGFLSETQEKYFIAIENS
jgi:hypothetical protein